MSQKFRITNIVKIAKITKKNKKFWIKTASFVLLNTLIIIYPIEAESKSTGKEIIQKSQDVSQLKGMEAISEMTIIDKKGRSRIRKIAQISKLYDNGNLEKKLVRFLAPADIKGTGLLTFDYKNKDDDIWLFMPALRKSRRIVSSEKAKNFMGSEFSYADMTPPNLEDFNFQNLGTEEVEGVICHKIKMTPKKEDIADENGFSQKIPFIDVKIFVIRKAVYHDLSGELHKILMVKEVKEIDKENHKYRPTHLIMENKQNGRKSILKMNQIKYSPKLEDKYFTVRYLEKV